MPSARDRGRQVLVYFGLAGAGESEPTQPAARTTARERVRDGVFAGAIFGVLMTIFTDSTAKDGVALALIYTLLMIGATLAYDRHSGDGGPASDERHED